MVLVWQNCTKRSFHESKGGSVESEAGNGSSSPRGKASDGIPERAGCNGRLRIGTPSSSGRRERKADAAANAE
jgi:hypothetical protein